MEDINKIIGKNLLILRKNAKLTQVELADTFNYSDKSISKWETGESLPSVEVLFELAKFYNVTLDDLTKPEGIVSASKKKKDDDARMFPSRLIITLLSVSVVWLIATILFVTLKIFLNVNYYMCFLWAVPVSCVLLIVFNSIWGKYRYLFIILSVLLWSVLTGTHIQILLSANVNIWPIYIVGAPLQIAIILWGALVKKPRGYYKKLKIEE